MGIGGGMITGQTTRNNRALSPYSSFRELLVRAMRDQCDGSAVVHCVYSDCEMRKEFMQRAGEDGQEFIESVPFAWSETHVYVMSDEDGWVTVDGYPRHPPQRGRDGAE